MDCIRKAIADDASRLAEIEIFNFRMNFYPIFRNDDYYFSCRQVVREAGEYVRHPEKLEGIFVYDDGVIKGFIDIDGEEVRRLFVEPAFQSKSVGALLLDYAVREYGVTYLWALEKNTRAIDFYSRHGFHPSGYRKYEEGTTEFLVRLERTRS